MIRARVPADEVDDLVQATLTDALASTSMPTDAEEMRRWVFGIARHKVVDFYRRSRREKPSELRDIPVSGAAPGSKDLMHWAEKQINNKGPTADETLDWMLREGEGEKLEWIAQEQQLPAPRVRKRVNRLRRHLRERWAAELAAVAAVAVVIGALWYLLRHRTDKGAVVVGPDKSAVAPVDSALLRAAQLRSIALDQCSKQQWKECLAGLDEAAKLDPVGDQAEAVSQARQGAAAALQTPTLQTNSPVPSSSPSNYYPTPDSLDIKEPKPKMKNPTKPEFEGKTTPAPKKTGPDLKKKMSSESDFNVAPAPTGTMPAPPNTAKPEQSPKQTKQDPESSQMQQQQPNVKKKGGASKTSREGTGQGK